MGLLLPAAAPGLGLRDVGYLLPAPASDLGRGVTPLVASPDLGRRVAPLGRSVYFKVRSISGRQKVAFEILELSSAA